MIHLSHVKSIKHFYDYKNDANKKDKSTIRKNSKT